MGNHIVQQLVSKETRSFTHTNHSVSLTGIHQTKKKKEKKRIINQTKPIEDSTCRTTCCMKSLFLISSRARGLKNLSLLNVALVKESSRENRLILFQIFDFIEWFFFANILPNSLFDIIIGLMHILYIIT